MQAGSDTDTVSLIQGANWNVGLLEHRDPAARQLQDHHGPIPGTQESGLVVDSDPSIVFGFGVTNDGAAGTAPTKYTFTFPMPAMALAVNLPAGTYNVSATFGDTLTANAGGHGGLFTGLHHALYAGPSSTSQDAGVDIAAGSNNSEQVVGGTEGNTQTFSFTQSLGQFFVSPIGTTMSVNRRHSI